MLHRRSISACRRHLRRERHLPSCRMVFAPHPRKRAIAGRFRPHERNRQYMVARKSIPVSHVVLSTRRVAPQCIDTSRPPTQTSGLIRIGIYSPPPHIRRHTARSVNNMDLHKAIYGRRAVRGYSDGAVDREVIDRLIDAAVQAPTALNQQPWLFTVVRDQRKLDELSSQAKAYMLAHHADMIRDSHLQMLNDPHYQIFYHAPALILLSAVAPGPWCIEDCALAAQNLMLAAYGEGLGSCWIGFAQAYLGTPAGKAFLRLPSACVPVAPIIVGVPREPAPAVPRKKPEITWVG